MDEDGVNPEEFIITEDNVKWPDYFWHTSIATGAVQVCDDVNVRREIKRGITYLRCHPDESYWYTAYGDLGLIVFNHSHDKEFFVVVTNSYYETDIPMTDKDLELFE